jgi:hypothetical protein
LKCKICSREAQDKGYCHLHLKAYENLVEKYKVWLKATEVSWKDYLMEIQKNSLTGSWAKEVAKQLNEEEEQ